MHTEEWWEKRLTQMARHFGGIAGLMAHDFRASSGYLLAASDGVSTELMDKYKKLSRNHPWGPYLWSHPVGAPIISEKLEVLERIADDRNYDAFVETLLSNNIAKGMGAVLWKDRPVAPRRVMAIGILKPSSLADYEVFSLTEQKGFIGLIPGLVEVAQHHGFVTESGVLDR